MREITLSEWQKSWSTTIKGNITKCFFPTIKDRIKTHIIHSFILTQFLSDHANFNTYLS
jgi:hypothetical protein